MGMFDWLWKPMEVPNFAGDVNASVAGSGAAGARSPSGSFDPNRIMEAVPEAYKADLAPWLQMQTALANQEREALTQAYKKPERTGLNFIGDVLSAASVPVSYAQGNLGYANAMAGNTTADKYNARVNAYQDKMAEAMGGSVSKLYSNLGQTGMKYMEDTYKRRMEARTKLGNILSAGSNADGTIKPEYASMAEQYAQANGFQAEWDRVKKSIKVGTPAATEPTPAPDPGNDPANIPAGAGTDASLGTRLGGFSAMSRNLPGAVQPKDPMPVPDVYQRPAHVQQMYNEAARISIVDKARGDIILDQAKIADKNAADIHAAQQKAKVASRQSTSTQLTPVYNPETDEWGYAQGTTSGEALLTQIPGGFKAVNPAENAAAVSSAREQGTNQGKAVSSIPQIERVYDTVMGIAGKLALAPGLANVTGKAAITGNLLWSDQLPTFREDTADAESLIEALDSQAFTLAFESLKGAGAITEMEGKAATAALSRLKNMRVSDSAYREALQDFLKIIERLRAQAYQKAQARVVLPGSRISTRPEANIPPPSVPTPNVGASPYSGMSDDEFLKRKR